MNQEYDFCLCQRNVNSMSACILCVEPRYPYQSDGSRTDVRSSQSGDVYTCVLFKSVLLEGLIVSSKGLEMDSCR